MRGLLAHVTARYRQLKEQKEPEVIETQKYGQQEKDKLIFQLLDQRRTLKASMERSQNFKENRTQVMSHDRQYYQEIRDKQRKVAEFRLRIHSGRTRGRPER